MHSISQDYAQLSLVISEAKSKLSNQSHQLFILFKHTCISAAHQLDVVLDELSNIYCKGHGALRYPFVVGPCIE